MDITVKEEYSSECEQPTDLLINEVKAEFNSAYEEDDLKNFETASSAQVAVTETWTYTCDLCDFACITSEDLRAHYLQRHAPRVLRTSTISQLNAKEKKYGCPYCDYRSNFVAHIDRHVLIHTGERPFSCPHCEYKCRDTSVLRRHILRHPKKDSDEPTATTSSSIYTCDLCSFQTFSQAALTRHYCQHQRVFNCSHCSYQTGKWPLFTNHILLHNGIGSHPCGSCDYKTNFATDLKKHVARKHLNIKSHACTECNYTTSCRSDLSKHATIHKSARPFSCDQCNYNCKRKSHLAAHLITHSREARKYVCTFCKYTTVNTSSLRIHVRKHTGEKPFICKTCGVGYTSHAILRTHSFVHIDDWSQTCTICNSTFDKPQLFKAHLKTHKSLKQRAQ